MNSRKINQRSPLTVRLKIGSRKSPLALVQVQEVIDLLKLSGLRINTDLYSFETAGDQDKKTPLTQNVADDFFTNTIDQALLDHTIDVAVHSAKDLPQKLNPSLTIVALTSCMDDSDAWVGVAPFADLPVNARVGTSSFLRQEFIKSKRSDVQLISIRGTIQERLNLLDNRKIDGFIVATCAMKRLKLEHRITEKFPWEGTPLQGQLAIVCRRDDQQMKQLFRPLDARLSYGSVALVGAGPGDPELITLKAIESLKKAQCVFYDYLVDPTLLRYAPKAEHVYVGKRKGAHAIKQAELSRLIKLKAMEGKNVVRLKGGDPLIFGRGADELAYLRAYHIPTEVIPGVSSATGIPSQLGVPLTARGVSSSVAFISAHGEDECSKPSLPIAIPDTQTVVIFMGLSKLSEIIHAFRLKKWPEDTPVMIISRGTKKNQQVIKGTLQTIEQAVATVQLKPPALIIVGRVTDFYQPVDKHKNILFLGTHPQEYSALGNIIHCPMIQISAKKFSLKERKTILQRLSEAQVVLLTSEYAVEYFDKFLEVSRQSLSSLKNIDFVVIGSYTAQALLDRGAHPRIIAPVETAQGVYQELKRRMKLKDLKIIFPRSSLPNPFLKKALIKAGADVFEFSVYENTPARKRPLPKISIDSVVFTSPSTVHNFLKDYKKIPESWEILCKGPVSLKALKDQGYSGSIIH